VSGGATLSFFQIYAIAGLAILGYITILWIASLALRDSSIVLAPPNLV
jgi:hypothetical protein